MSYKTSLYVKKENHLLDEVEFKITRAERVYKNFYMLGFILQQFQQKHSSLKFLGKISFVIHPLLNKVLHIYMVRTEHWLFHTRSYPKQIRKELIW
jgi:hypothetical protein